MKNKLTARVLASILDTRKWTQSDLANRTGIIYTTVSTHLSGQRALRDEHLRDYLRVLDRHERRILLSAWMRDQFDPEIVNDVIDVPTGRIHEAVGAWSPALDSEQKKMLRWWADQLSRDPELDKIFREITRKAGWPNPADKSTHPFIITDSLGRVVYLNAAFSKMCGYTLTNLRNKKPGEKLQGKETDKTIVRNFGRAIRERRPFECTLTNYHADGHSYRVHIKSFPVFDSLGTLIQFRAVEEIVQ